MNITSDNFTQTFWYLWLFPLYNYLKFSNQKLTFDADFVLVICFNYTLTRSVCVIIFLNPLSQSLDFSVQFSSVTQSCPAFCDPMNRSTPGLPVHHQLPEFTQTQIHRVGDAIQPSHPLSSPSPPATNPSQHQSLFQWVNSLHEVAKVLEFQL